MTVDQRLGSARGSAASRGWTRRSPAWLVVRAMWASSPRATAALVVLVLCGATLATLAVVTPGWMINQIVSAVDDPQQEAAAWWAVGALVSVLLLQEVVSSITWPTAARVARMVEGSVHEGVMSSVMARHDIEIYSDPDIRRSVDESVAVGSARYGPSFAVEGLVRVATNLISGLTMAVVVSLAVWWLGPLLAATWLLARHLVRRERVALLQGYSQQAQASRRIGYFRDLVLQPAAAKEIRVFGLQSWVVDGFDRLWRMTMASVWRQRRPQMILLPALSLGVVAVYALCVTVLVRQYSGGELGVGGLIIALQALFGTSAISMVDVGNSDVHVDWGSASIHSEEDLAAHLAVTDRESGKAAAPDPLKTIRLEEVSYRYPQTERDVLAGLDLELPVGSSLAIVGRNGAGKTTLVKLLTGLLDPREGQVTVDGVDVSTLDRESWQQKFAPVFQAPLRFPGTIRDNVTLGCGDVQDERLQAEVARLSGLDEVLAGRDRSWSTPVTNEIDGGVDLSGGEWQRVALARALWGSRVGSPVLVLDEPTAAMDVEAETKFYDQFLRLTADVTTVVISHRFSTVRRADSIAVIEHGRVSEHGTHEELLRLDGTYARQFHLQADVFRTEAQS